MADPIAFRQRVLAGAVTFAVAAAMALALVGPFGCSSSSASSGCDAARCAAGNECIDDGSGSGPACHKVCTSSTDCPFNWSCNSNPSRSWCVVSSFAVPEKQTGQWGASCSPSGGEQGNPACDVADQFSCYGINPTDANAFCTILGCASDSDCPGGWWCATVNAAPSVRTNKPSFGPVRNVCMPRAYCAPCSVDHDCPPASDGTQQHCLKDTKGNGYCAPECGGDANCALDATCTNWQSLCTPAQGPICRSDDDCPSAGAVAQHCDSGRCSPECGGDGDCASVGDAGAPAKCAWHRACSPRAGVCLGGGGFCSPCRSDHDCKNGYCLSGMPYSTERFCSVKSTNLPCNVSTLDPLGCPRAAGSDNWRHSDCTSTPADQCEGLVSFGTSTGQAAGVPGCWTPNR